MINYDLPTFIEIDGIDYPIVNNGDFRAILDVICILNDKDLDEQEKAFTALMVFYGEITTNPQEAIKKIMWFINCGEEETPKESTPQIMDWEQDFPILVAPINRVLNNEVRALKYLHWWTFVSAYMEIGECTFSNVVSIRKKRQKGIQLDKSEQEFFRNNPDMILLKNQMSQEDIDFMSED